MKPPPCNSPFDIARKRQRGVVLMLVLIAVAISATLALSFVSAQSTSIGIARSITDHSEARYVAESGLELAIAYIRANADWRTEQSNGTWVTDESFGGGTFTIVGDDGQDTDGDGVITIPTEGDSDLADDVADPLTLKVIGTVNSVTHVVHAVLTPVFHPTVLMVVPDPANLSAEDSARKTQLESWDFTVVVTGKDSSDTDFNTALNKTEVVYLPNYLEPVKDFEKKIKDLTHGVVVEEAELFDTKKGVWKNELPKKLNLPKEESVEYTDNRIDIVEILVESTDDAGNPIVETVTHYITETFTPGSLSISGSSLGLYYMSGAYPLGAFILGKNVSGGQPTLLAISGGANLQTDPGKKVKSAPGARVVLPWGQDGVTISSLNDNGQLLIKRSIEWSARTWTGTLPGIGVREKVEVKGTGRIDSFDSSIGPYGGGNVSGNATVATNSSSAGKLKVKDSGVLDGHAYAGPEGNAGVVVTLEGSGVITGTMGNLTALLPVTPPAEPNLGGSLGDVTYATGTTTLSAGAHYNKLTLTGDAILQIDGEVAILCDGDFMMEGTSKIEMQPEATLSLYGKSKMEVTNNAQINVNTADPSVVTIYPLSKTFTLRNDAQVYAVIQTFGGKLEVKDAADFYGMFIGKEVKVDGGSFHADLNLSAGPGNMGGAGSGATISVYDTRWVEGP